MLLIKKILENIILIFINFFDFWWKSSFLWWKEKFGKAMFRMERTFAVKINFFNIFRPLYQDYTFIGYTFGFILRATRVIVGSLIYLIIFILFAGLYLVWALLPFWIACKTFC